MDISRLAELDWRVQVGLKQGLQETFDWFINNQNVIRH